MEISDLANAREQLKKKFGNTRTGGKGTVRRKIKKKSNIISTRISDKEKDFNRCIDNVNECIISIETEHIEIWNSYLEEQWLFDIISDFRKKDFPKKTDFQYIKDNYEECISIFLIHESDLYNNKMLFNKDYNFFLETFSDDGYNYILNSITNLNNIIKKKEYIHLEKEVKIENIDKLYDILELDKTEIPTKSDLKKAYLKKSTLLHPDKHPDEIEKYSELFANLSDAYKKLLNYHYNNCESNNHLYTTQ